MFGIKLKDVMGKDFKSIREYTDDELYEFLKRNESTDFKILAGICSEVLRRQIEKTKGDTP